MSISGTVEKHLEDALGEFSRGDLYAKLLEAKEYYFSRAGKADEEDDDYESRMSHFNNWFLTQYREEGMERPMISLYVEKRKLSEEVARALTNPIHSVYEYAGTNLRKQHVVKDIIRDEKYSFPKDDPFPSVVKNDLFLGRVLQLGDSFYMMNGLCFLPKDVRSAVKKEGKRVLKLGDPGAYEEFLFKVENLKTKWRHYGHIDPKKIFVF